MAPIRTVLVTGGTIGLGYWAAQTIARAHPEYLVVISARSDATSAADVINASLKQTNTIFLPIDLASTANVRAFAENWVSKSFPPIQALVLNAGIQLPGALKLTAEGVETTFAINHVGHALLFHLLAPHLAPNARVVVTASGTHDPAQKTGVSDAVYTSAEALAHPPPDAINIPGRQRYTTSKLANVLWTYALQRRLNARAPDRKITVNAFDPGLMPGTGLARETNAVVRFLWKNVLPRMLPVMRMLVSPNIHTPAESGAALARLAIGEDVEGVGGKYFEGMRERESSVVSYEEAKQDDLWGWTVKFLRRDEAEGARWEEFK
ncbi:hypothetical protein B0T19DRAFT_416710 [Cercophora scortea]|uniref:Uncharacterized protein n=1 Tax=Cercophora scortea TaxID=314031 RepID=A0AAE0IXB7_9PEZI|nr:hypothetical protein B0T19DRAFT_416710 [Cercophora scortea]